MCDFHIRGSVGIRHLTDFRLGAQEDQITTFGVCQARFSKAAPCHVPKAGYALRPDVRGNTGLTITGCSRHRLLSGTTRSTSLWSSLIETSPTAVNAAAKYHCMNTLELYPPVTVFLRPAEHC